MVNTRITAERANSEKVHNLTFGRAELTGSDCGLSKTRERERGG